MRFPVHPPLQVLRDDVLLLGEIPHNPVLLLKYPLITQATDSPTDKKPPFL